MMDLKERGRRSKERYVKEAIQLVQQWRDYFENGVRDEGGNIRKVSLHQAAEIVGISKKTLEDYYSILRKAEQIIDLDSVSDQKMGYIRSLIKDHKHEAEIPTSQCREEQQNHEKNPNQQEYEMQWNNMTIEIDNSNFYDDPVDSIYYDLEERRDFIDYEDFNNNQLYYDQINTVTTYSNVKQQSDYYDSLFFFRQDSYHLERPRSLSRNSAGVHMNQMEDEIFFAQATPDE